MLKDKCEIFCRKKLKKPWVGLGFWNPPELSSDIIDLGIIMTGGSSQLRNFPELLFRRTGVKAVLADDAYFCVVKGTGVALAHLDIYKKPIIAKR